MADLIPSLPREISPDGREIWDWAARFSEATHRAARISELTTDIVNIAGRCGSCRMWMTRQCPKERNVSGRNHGPSMNAPKCPRFEMKASSEELRRQWIAEREALLTPSQQDGGVGR